ncbi:hypothetical protein [Microbacterium arabinogalactanolyticum]|uniref:hypothetical protein n=1 Tax=Microbacterium arabinogalactanolyticum TaxID=69365 RepID=UPI0025559084|nr:hypothetical protein [Microbacterium arabinogalactanolyticum]GLC84765.1 hypothetical protein MIAR_13530 [Microbacterium arabinogalactanolyticum]
MTEAGDFFLLRQQGAAEGQRQESGIHVFTWRVWPWMSWLLPVLFVGHGFFGGGGWETLFLLLISPILVPAAGLLGSLPRFVLRRAGSTAVPAPITWVLFVHWWSWIVASMSMRGATDAAPTPSMMQGLAGGQLSSGYSDTLFIGGLVVVLVSWVAIVVLALARGRLRQSRRWTVIAWVAAFAAPLLIAGLVVGGCALSQQQADAAGETHAHATALPLEEQTARLEQRYEASQRMLAEVRALIAKDGWRVDAKEIDDLHGCTDTLWDCYRFQLGFRAEPTGDFDLEESMPALRDLGWRVSRDAGAVGIVRLRGEGPHGEVLSISQHTDDGAVEVSLYTGFWWDEAHDGAASAISIDGLVDDDRFAADEWPSLAD